MRKSLLPLLLVIGAWLMSSTAWAELKQVNGVYQIGTAQDLADFGAKIPTTPQMSAVLTADIAYNGDPLGGSKAFHGVLDGQGHTITLNQNRTAQGGGLFWSAEAPAVVKNLTVNGVITTTKDKCGAFGFYGSGAFINCVADVTINSTFDGDASHGGFVANGYENTRIVNCVCATKINGGGKSKNAGGFIGWNNNPKCQIVNSICVAEISDMVGTGSNSIARHGSGNTPAMTNAYFLNKLDVADGAAQQTTAAALTDGSLLANLNGFDATMKWTQGEAYPVPVPSSEVYVITTPQDLVNFTTHVNKGNVGLSARVEADLDLDGIATAPIGNDIWNYRATFDGQGHTISNLNIDCASPAGLFGTIAGNAVICNLVLDATCSVKSTGYAGIIGHSTGAEKVWLTGLGNLGTVSSTGKGVGGIIGNCNASSVLVADKCWSAGAISGAGDAAAICGWTNFAGSSITNCWSISEVSGKQDDAHYFFRFGTAPATSGNYCTGGTQTPNMSKADVLSGKFCYATLNGESSANPTWFQKLDGQSLPTIFGSDVVYCAGEFNCDGSEKGSVNYNNVSGSNTTDPHTLVDGLCSKCGMAGLDGDYFILPTAKALRWFSDYVANVNNFCNAKLTADIDLSGDNFQPIGTEAKAFTGIFDGQGHKISNMTVVNDENTSTSVAGFFGKVFNANIKNLWLDETCSVSGSTKAMGGICGQTTLANTTNFYNVGFAGTVNNASTLADAGTAGILGQANASAIANFDYCWVAGSITGQKDVAAISAWEGSVGAHMANCWVAADLSKFQDDAHYMARCGSNYTVTNCYANKGTQGGKANITAEMIATGELACTMGAAWGQTIGTDEYPVVNGEKVYAVGAAGYATLYDEASDWTLGGDVQAFIGTKKGEYLSLTEIDDIPAGTAVILKGTYYNKVAGTASANTTDNDLLGSTEAVESDGTYYVLAKKDDTVGFYRVAAGTSIPAGKAYLTSTSGIKAYIFGDGEDDATGISKVNDNDNAEVYNLAGQRLQRMQQGINIVGGKKISLR